MAYETEDHETQYCFPDINSSCIKGKRFRYEYSIMYVFFSLLSAWTVFLNLLVIISISHFKKLHTPTNLLILSLAVADLLIGLIVMPVDAIRRIETCWYFGDTYCDVFMIFLGITFSTSIFNLVLIAVDRYMAVCHPLLYPHKISTTKTAISICVCWFFSSAYNISFLVTGKYFATSQNAEKTCYGNCYFIVGFSWMLTDLFFSFLCPLAVIISLYLRIFFVAHKQVKVINSLMAAGKSEMEGSMKRKYESKAALTLGIIVIVYMLCYIPFYIFSVADIIVSSTAMTFLAWIFYANSGLNPLIYALFYRWFKLSVKHILTLKILEPASSLLDIFKE